MHTFKNLAPIALFAFFAFSLATGAVYAQAHTNPSGTTTTLSNGDIYRDDSRDAVYVNYGELTVTGKTPNGGAEIMEAGYGGTGLINCGDAMISGGMVRATGSYGTALVNHDTATILSGRIRATGDAGCAIFDDGALLISGGEIVGSEYALWENGGTATITGGVFTGRLFVDSDGELDIVGKAFTDEHGDSIAFGSSITSGAGSFRWMAEDGTEQKIHYAIGTAGGTINFVQATPEFDL